MKRPLISIIVPAKDCGDSLGRLLDSLDRLWYPRDRLEIIICDNGSGDDTAQVALARGCVVLELPGLSIAAMRNRGVARAAGAILAFVDADCTVSSSWLVAALPHLERADVVAAGCYPSPPENGTWVQELWTLKERLKPRVHEAGWLPSMNLIVKKEAFEAVGGFDAALKTCEDVDLCYRLQRRGGIIIWDRGIEVTHHGEPATLAILFKKERWHGTSNWKGAFRHGLRWEELPSLALPVVVLGAYAIPLAAWTAGLATGPILPLLSTPLLLVPPLLATAAAARTSWRARRPLALPQLTVIYLVYLWARASALLPV